MDLRPFRASHIECSRRYAIRGATVHHGWHAAPASPLARHTPAGADADAVFDVKAIYQQSFEDVDIAHVPAVFFPTSGPLRLTDWEKVYAAGPDAWRTTDIFDERELSRDGVVVVVRPDQYVAAVLPLSATDELADFFAGAFLDQRAAALAAGASRAS